MDSRKLRRALGSYMTGVTVVTACTDAGLPVGFTANSFTSVSLDPPLLLVCPGNHLRSFEVFRQVRQFAVSVLAEGQEGVSNVFASAGEDRFAQTPWQPDRQGLPLIDGACAWFSCRVHQRHSAGDHLILVGEIIDFAQADRHGLGYAGNGYFSLTRERRSDAASPSGLCGTAGVLLEHDGRLLIARERDGIHLPQIELSGESGPRSALERYFGSLPLSVALGPVYSVYEDRLRRRRNTIFRARASTGETAGLGHFEPIAALRAAELADPAQASMLTRFLDEYASADFGFYLGTEAAGEVHRTRYEAD